MDNLRGLSEEFRLAYGAGIVLMMGNIARLELNYVVPVRAQTGDRWERERDRVRQIEEREKSVRQREREQKRETEEERKRRETKRRERYTCR